MDLWVFFLIAPFNLVSHEVSSSGETFPIGKDENVSDLSASNKPFIDGDHIVNATRGQMISLKCTVHNIKNYKVIMIDAETISL